MMYTMEIGYKIAWTATESISLQGDKYTKEKSEKVVRKAMENASMKMEGSMRECGSRIVKLALERWNFPTRLFSSECLTPLRHKPKACFSDLWILISSHCGKTKVFSNNTIGSRIKLWRTKLNNRSIFKRRTGWRHAWVNTTQKKQLKGFRIQAKW